jgi:hypothetical protein
MLWYCPHQHPVSVSLANTATASTARSRCCRAWFSRSQSGYVWSTVMTNGESCTELSMTKGHSSSARPSDPEGSWLQATARCGNVERRGNGRVLFQYAVSGAAQSELVSPPLDRRARGDSQTCFAGFSDKSCHFCQCFEPAPIVRLRKRGVSFPDSAPPRDAR